MTIYNFSQYDILYSFSPIKNYDKMKIALDNVCNTMKKGAIFYFVKAGTIDVSKFTKLTDNDSARPIYFYIKE